MSIAIYKDATELKTKIKAMLGNAQKLKLSIHECLVNAELHNRAHGDVGPLNRIFVGTKEVNHGNTVAKYIAKECGVVWNNETNSFDHSAKKVTKFKGEDDFEAANAALILSTPYWKLVKPEANPFGFVFAKELAILKAKAARVANGQHATRDQDGAPLELTAEELAAVDKKGELKVDMRGYAEFKKAA